MFSTHGLAALLVRLPQLLPLSPPIIDTPSAISPSEAVQHLLMDISLERWIYRIGGLIAFIGAIKLGLSLRSDDAREQVQAVLIMVSGFMIQAAISDLNIFNMPAVYTDANATAEFQAILRFIGRWMRRVGMLAMFLGAASFAHAIKDHDPASKVSGLKTMAAGGVTAAVSAILWTFV